MWVLQNTRRSATVAIWCSSHHIRAGHFTERLARKARTPYAASRVPRVAQSLEGPVSSLPANTEVELEVLPIQGVCPKGHTPLHSFRTPPQFFKP
jgi:hypothetical protein